MGAEGVEIAICEPTGPGSAYHIAKLEPSFVEAIHSEATLAQAYELILSIMGFGVPSAAAVLTKIPDLNQFADTTFFPHRLREKGKPSLVITAPCWPSS